MWFHSMATECGQSVLFWQQLRQSLAPLSFLISSKDGQLLLSHPYRPLHLFPCQRPSGEETVVW